MPAPKEVKELVERFDRNIEAYKSGKYNETQLRREFIDPLFEALGWDVNNKQGYAEAYKDVIHEDSIKVSGGTKAPDYCFRIGGQRKFFVEAKKPSVNIKNEPSPAYQIRRYAWSSKLPLSILTDFEEFVIYDCLIKPSKNDSASFARVNIYSYKDFIDKWDEISSVFSKDAVQKGSFDKYAESGKKKRGTTEVDDVFLKEIENWREMLAKNIAVNNPKLSQEDLNFVVQKTIDRIIFLRICEDRHIEDYGRLMALQNGTQVYKRLSQIFREADDKYNSGLFHFQEEKGRPEHFDGLSLKLKLDDDILKEIIKGLYYPESPYEFSVLPSDILGHVYEQFLGKVIRLTAGHRAVIEEKPEVRKAGGIYYTPTYIVDYIVKNTVGKLLEEKTPEKVSKLRILDPACGSGSFLIQAYQYLLDWHRDHYVNKDPKKYAAKRNPALFKDSRGEWILTTGEKKRILLNNIYGVDIDSQAVEVTKLSLLLKVLEGETEQTINSNLRLFHERALPDLGNNIKCGNSLIGPDFYKDKNLSLFGNEDMRKINAFDWNDKEKGFGEIMRNGDFDAVIGNPPYVFTRELMSKNEKEYFYEKYINTQFKLNTYVLFCEKSFNLLNKKGLFGFIIPNNWLSLEYTSDFRKYILTNAFDINIVNALDSVFEKASVDTSILIFRKIGKPYAYLKELSNGIFTDISEQKTANILQSHNYVINIHSHKADKYLNLCKKIKEAGRELSEIAEVKNGVQAYTVGEGTPIQTKQIKDERAYHSNQKKNNLWIKYVDGVDVKRYMLGWSGQYIKYGNNLSRPREARLFQDERLLVRQIPSKPPYSILCSYTNEKLINDNNSMIIKLIQPDSRNIKYIMGILNSRLISFWFVHTFGKMQRKIFPQFKVKELSIFPIKPYGDKDKIPILVTDMIEMQDKYYSAKSESDKRLYQQKIELIDRQIDGLVYKLYGLTEEEIKVVEGGT